MALGYVIAAERPWRSGAARCWIIICLAVAGLEAERADKQQHKQLHADCFSANVTFILTLGAVFILFGGPREAGVNYFVL